MRILICESDDLLRDLLKDAVAESGHEVCGIATGSKEALLMVPELRPDAAMVDPLLKDGSTELSLVEDLARFGVPSVLIAKSGDVAPASTAARAILSMPFDLDDLAEALASLRMDETMSQSDDSRS